MLGTDYHLETIPYYAGELLSPCPPDHLYVVLKGTIEVRIGDRTHYLQAGEAIPCHRAAIAHTDCRLGIVDRTQYQAMLAQTPYQTLSLSRIFGMRLPTQSLVFSDLG